MTDRELVARIAASAGRKAGYKQLVRELGLGGGRERRLLLEQLARLTSAASSSSSIASTGAFPVLPPARVRAGQSSDNLLAGRLDLHRDGYGFVRPNRKSGAPGSTGTEDIFIPPNEINGAMQGDQVLVEVDPPKADGRMPGPHRPRSRAPQPHRRRHVSLRRSRLAVTGKTSSFPSTSA